MGEATEDDFAREFLALKMSVAVVPDLEAAIAHVNRYGTGHTEAIVTEDIAAARRFVGAVDAGTVVVNASTRFTDGEEFGFGAEIGISTQKLHARGPMGLRELTTYKYVVWGGPGRSAADRPGGNPVPNAMTFSDRLHVHHATVARMNLMPAVAPAPVATRGADRC